MKPRRDLLWLFLLALAVRLAAAWPQHQPAYMDESYSVVVAQNLLAGRGFVEDFLWNYLDNPAPPPHPSHLYWMPLTSILAWLGMRLFGAGYSAAQIPFALLSALLPLLAYRVTRHLGGDRRRAWLAGLLVIFSGFYFPYWTAVDNFTPFGLFAALALFLAWRGMDSPPPPPARPLLAFLAAGACAGLAHLARADGPLLLAAIVPVWLTRRQPAARRWAGLGLLLAGYLLVMSPWLARSYRLTGALLPVAGSKTIWLTGYDDLFSYGRELSWRTFLAQGWGPILQGRWWALTANLQTVLAVWGMVVLAPLALAGGWTRRRHALVQMVGLYAGLLFAVMTVVFAFPGARGGLFHSGAALLPFVAGLGVLGLDTAVAWAASRRRHWRAATASRVFGAGLVVLAVSLSLFIYNGRVLRNNAWNTADRGYADLARWVAARKPDAVVMVNNPPAYRYHGGGLSVVTPNEDVDTTLRAADRYGVDYLVLEPNHPAPLHPLYTRSADHPRLRLVKQFGGTLVFEILPPGGAP